MPEAEAQKRVVQQLPRVPKEALWEGNKLDEEAARIAREAYDKMNNNNGSNNKEKGHGDATTTTSTPTPTPTSRERSNDTHARYLSDKLDESRHEALKWAAQQGTPSPYSYAISSGGGSFSSSSEKKKRKYGTSSLVSYECEYVNLVY